MLKKNTQERAQMEFFSIEEFKMELIQHFYGISSLRQTCEEIKMNVAYK